MISVCILHVIDQVHPSVSTGSVSGEQWILLEGHVLLHTPFEHQPIHALMKLLIKALFQRFCVPHQSCKIGSMHD